jgi:hypothetical protein
LFPVLRRLRHDGVHPNVVSAHRNDAENLKIKRHPRLEGRAKPRPPKKAVVGSPAMPHPAAGPVKRDPRHHGQIHFRPPHPCRIGGFANAETAPDRRLAPDDPRERIIVPAAVKGRHADPPSGSPAVRQEPVRLHLARGREIPAHHARRRVFRRAQHPALDDRADLSDPAPIQCPTPSLDRPPNFRLRHRPSGPDAGNRFAF